jgi:hypothetical protein
MRGVRARLPVAGLAAASIAVGVLSQGCSTSSSSKTDVHQPTATSSPVAANASPKPATPGQQAMAAYLAMWADVATVGHTVDYQSPLLAVHLQGQPLLTFKENLAVDKSKGIVGRGTPLLNPTVVAEAPAVVTLRDCMNDEHWLEYYAATGKPVDNVSGGHRYVAATVTDANAAWKVTSLDVRAEGTC